MPRRIVLSVLAICVTAVSAGAADLATQSPLGRIFEEPVGNVAVVQQREYSGPIVPYTNLPNPVWNRGVYNYGSSWSYYDGGPYYGGPYTPSFVRLPYVCGLYGYCF